MLVSNKDKHVCIDAVRLQRRQSLPFPDISILILGINLDIYSAN